MTRLLRGGRVARVGRFAVALVGVLGGTLALCWLAGTALPAESVVKAETTVALPRDALFRTLAAGATQAAWRRDIREVTAGPDGTFIERDERGLTWWTKTTVAEAPQRLVVELRTPAGERVAERSVTLVDAPPGTRVLLHLRTQHDSPLERFAALLMGGDAQEAAVYLDAVAALAPR
ncbi:MAG: hypothetical protein HY904_22850 [Deltaproteobacteria bacterium]|nr:hypothetical protein [Deltaproteobacteria bacterium]